MAHNETKTTTTVQVVIPTENASDRNIKPAIGGVDACCFSFLLLVVVIIIVVVFSFFVSFGWPRLCFYELWRQNKHIYRNQIIYMF